MSRPDHAPRRITTQILLAVLLPVIALTAALTAYHAFARYQDLTMAEREIGEATINYLARAAELGVYANDEQALTKLARSTMSRPSVHGVAFLDDKGAPMVVEGDIKLQTAPTPDSPGVGPGSATLLFRHPIRLQSMDIEDFGGAGETEAREAEIIGWVVLAKSRSTTVDRIQQMLLTTLLLALGAILIGVLFALNAGSTIGRPVRQLTAHFRQLDKADADFEFEPRGSEEIVTLATGINQLVARIRLQLARQHEEIAEATTNLSTRNRELEESRRVLEQALKSKDDFLARISHELRTPLTTIIGFNRLIGASTSVEQATEYNRHIEHASGLLHSIIDDILDYSRLQSAYFELESIPFDLEGCMEDVVGMHGYEAVAKRLELVLLIDGDVPRHGIGDPQRLQQVVNNLLANALKFTPEGEVIIRLVVLQRQRDKVRLQCEIRDTGIGLPTDDRDRLFQPFTQADNSITRKYGGSGLGLAISRSLVQLMGGEIELSSEAGQGTTVTFSFDLQLDPTTGPGDPSAGQARTPVLVYDGNDWSRRAVRSALFHWSMDIAVCAGYDNFMEQLPTLDSTALVVLSLSHGEAQIDKLAPRVRAIRRHFEGSILLLSPVPDLAAHMGGTDIATAKMGFAMKPLRRQHLVEQCRQLVNPMAAAVVELPAPEPLAGLQILVAEDHTLIRDLLARNLRSAGAGVEAVADGEQAVLACLGAHFDLLLMDLHMPRMDGISATRSIRAQGGTMPILCLTADITAQERDTLRECGIDAVLLKPINEAELIRQILLQCGHDAEAETVAASDIATAGSSHVTPRVKETLLKMIEDGRCAFTAGDEPGYNAILHDLLGLAGMYEERLLEEMTREIKRQGFKLTPEEAAHLFAEAETLIQKY